MRFLIAVAALVLASMMSIQSKAAWRSLNTLKEYCDAPEGTEMRGGCIGYILGVADTLDYKHSFEPAGCTPSNATADQLVAVVEKHMDNNPEKLHKDAHKQVTNALILAFNCSTDFYYGIPPRRN